MNPRGAIQKSAVDVEAVLGVTRGGWAATISPPPICIFCKKKGLDYSRR